MEAILLLKSMQRIMEIQLLEVFNVGVHFGLAVLGFFFGCFGPMFLIIVIVTAWNMFRDSKRK